MLARNFFNSLLSAAISLLATGILFYFVFLAATGGDGVFAGVFLSVLAMIFSVPSLLAACAMNVLTKGGRKFFAFSFSLLVGIAFFYWVMAAYITPDGVLRSGNSLVFKESHSASHGGVVSALSFLMLPLSLFFLIDWLIGRKNTKTGKLQDRDTHK